LEEGLTKLGKSVTSEDRITIGACTSQIIGIPVKKSVKNDLITFVPLREHVAWVHPEGEKSATNKAIVLLADAAVRLDHMEPLAGFEENMVERILVIGGGISGLKAAADLKRLKVDVTLLEPIDHSDDMYHQSSWFMEESETLFRQLKTLNKSLSRVERVQGTLESFDGQTGSYEISWKDSKGDLTTKDFGAVIIATGNQQYLPGISKKCRYGKSDRVVTLQNIQQKQPKKSTILVATDPDVQMYQIEGSNLLRSTTSLARAGNTVFVTHLDIRTEDEDLYRAARESGVIFLRGSIKQVKEDKGGLKCRIDNTLESMVREVTVDALAVVELVGPTAETTNLATVMGLELDDRGFIKTRYRKMKPVQTSRRGIFIAGGAKNPMSLPKAMTSAQNAVLEGVKTIRHPMQRSGWMPVVDEETCDVCKACVEACPNDALRVFDSRIVHIPVHCEFCGICVSSCPTRAIEFQSHSKESWFARFETIAKTHKRLEKKRPFTLVYACSECANASIDQAGFTNKTYPPGTYVVQFPCAGMVSPIEILKGLVVGAERVIVAHCPPGGCHHQTGDHQSEMVVSLTRDMLREIGQNPDRVRATYMMAATPEKMQKEVGLHG
jgi:heterodisulfide reductase subunit A